MGHDIYAYRPDVNRDALYGELRLNEHDDNWLDRYDDYERRTEIAYNRRSAGNPLNQVLYLALGVMDEAYAGCSGNGETLEITLEQFEQAAQILETKNFEGMERERNPVDDIIDSFRRIGANVVKGTVGQDGNVTQEKEFIQKCLRYMREHELERLPVHFG